MKSISKICKNKFIGNYSIKAFATFKPESYLQVPQEEKKISNMQTNEYLVSVKKFEKGVKYIGLKEGELPIPVSPVLGPIKVFDPVINSKKYKWCSCGMSFKQPFCDRSHEGTAFKPLRFSVEEPAKQIELCGCKFTKDAPFCDGQTCLELREAESKLSKNQNS